MKFKIRLANQNDLEQINNIYNYYVVESTCTFQTEPVSDEARLEWFQNRSEKHPVIVACKSNKIIGWGSISLFKGRSAYKFTGEVAIYVDYHFRQNGIGTSILTDLLAHAEQSDMHALIAVVSADQEPSIQLHKKLGFETVGRLVQAGYKFDKWLDVVYMQYILQLTKQ
jgi:phosphinothricin acetyltransferase